MIEVTCPECSTQYRTCYRPSINLRLDAFDADYVRRVTTGTCPKCGSVVDLGGLIVQEDGTWILRR